jgi:hypothetical protein
MLHSWTLISCIFSQSFTSAEQRILNLFTIFRFQELNFLVLSCSVLLCRMNIKTVQIFTFQLFSHQQMNNPNAGKQRHIY